ncbi:phenylalanine--tRNA ligase subunit alpha [Patescibacteria group bacterium]|nr:phenylalanine--tRNA ligase subunit alpha [Patescibacteria group bacterium]MBU4453008.1 phenylalanine--tRNA ligase subunit alpha [Patescibacteria group bacterium]MCG2687762.1 phenylalanine--tRNA ligase subunit alpha [Candidatus Parcubacteria bacterium]
MKQELEQLKQAFSQALEVIESSDALEALRIEYLGRKGKLTDLLKGLKDLSPDDRKEIGAFANEVKIDLEAQFARKQSELASLFAGKIAQEEWIDITAPGIEPEDGNLHLTTQSIEEIADIFTQLGFVRVRHPEVEWDWYAFESLNMPKDHAARDEWETFFIADGDKIMEGKKGKVVLTPHTTNGQVREIEKGQLPIRMMNINKCYRRQADVTHAPMFHQFEGLMIDKNVTIAQLKGVFDFFVKRFFGPDREVRLRPHHFRFTEPSFELDISCNLCGGIGKVDGKKCRMCKQGWLELGGAGMVHPNVIKAGGLDPEVYTGFAFGWGVERTFMMKSGMNIADIRILYKNDLRFLKQF